jgi:hypothetical protein
MAPLASPYSEIIDERTYQDGKWGTAFDDKNTINDWAAYIGIYLATATTMHAPKAKQREGLLKVASLAVAALQAFDRNGGFPPRHYDNP